MAANTDGSVIIGVNMNVNQAEKELAKLKQKIEQAERDIANTQQKRDEARQKSALEAGVLDAEKAKLQEIKDRLSDIQAMAKDKSLHVDTREYAKALIPAVQQELAEQRERVSGLQTAWNKTTSEAERYDQKLKDAEAALELQKVQAGELQRQINEAERQRAEAAQNAKVSDEEIIKLNQELVTLKARQAELEQAGLGLGYQEYDANAARIAEITRALKEYQKALNGETSGGQEKPAEQINRTALAAERMNAILSGTAGTLQTAGRAVSSVFQTASHAVQSAAGWAAYAGKNMNALTRLTDAAGKKFHYFSRMLKRTFMTFTILKGLRAIRQQIASYLPVNAELTASLSTMKGVFLTAFQPVYEIAVPALIALVNVLTRAVAAISQFTAVLFGTTAKQAQENAKALYAQANAANAAGSAADSAAKSMAAFDEINQLQDSSSGSGGASSAVTAPSFDYDYEDTIFDSWGEAFSAFLDKILNNIPKLEKALLGFADRMNALSQKFYDMFTFPGVLEKVQQLGRDLANAFNSMVDRINWYQLGQALGAGLNLALQFLVNFLYTFDWINLGRRLADYINGLASAVDWYAFGRLLWAGFKISLELLAGFLLGLNMPEMAEAASNIVKGFFDSMKESIENIEWREIGEQIRTFLTEVDWKGVADSIFGAVKSAFTASSDFFSGLLGDELKRIVTDLLIFLGGASLVIGAVLAFTGTNIPLGLGLMAKGALALGAAAALDWEYVSGNIGKIVTTMMGILGGALLVLGAILTFSGANIPLGIGLIAMGAALLTTTLAVNWDILPNTIDGVASKITAILSVSFLALGAILLLTGANIPLGLGLIAVGAVGLAAFIAANWETIQPKIEGVLLALKIAAEAATLALGVVLLFSGAGIPLGLGLIGLGAAGLASTIIPNWDAIRNKLSDVWKGIKSWWSGDVEEYTKKKHWEGIGRNVADGLIDGLDTVHSKLNRWSTEVAQTINRTMREVNSKMQTTSLINTYPRAASVSYPDISSFNIPALAQGAVIPPNREFLAVLGDQRSGTNIEAPLATMVQAFRQALNEGGYGGGNRDIHITLELDKREFGRAVYTANNDETQRVGVRLVGVRT